MIRKCAASALLACAIGLAPAVNAAPHASAETRTSFGQPSLEGTWEANFLLSMEAPPKTSALKVSGEEAKQVAAAVAKAFIEQSERVLDPEVPASMLTVDGLALVRGERRSRAIVEPADGMLPYTPEAKAALSAKGPPAVYDNPENRTDTERCLYGVTAPPLSSLIFLNRLQIIQTRDQVVIHTEYGDDLRIIPFADKHGPAIFYPRFGNSIAHWEGATLVIETIGLPSSGRVRIFPTLVVTANSKVIERLTRVSKTELLYQFTVIDPKVYAKPWMAEFSWYPSARPMYEHACHEGNYSLPDILAGARYGEKVAADTAAAGNH